MNQILHALLGISLLGVGGMLFSMHIGEFNKHYQIQAHPITAQGFVTEVIVDGGKSEIHYEFIELNTSNTYTGISILEGTQYAQFYDGMPTPVEYADGKPEMNRHQFARQEIYTRGRNVAVGAFLVLMGPALIARGFRSSTAVAT